MPRYVDIECDAVTEVIGRRAFKSREDIQDFLNNIPTADVQEVKHGEWHSVGIAASCSICRKWLVVEQSNAKLNYCPNCGARMDGSDAK